MSESVHTNTSLWSKGMKAVIVAQFLSAFGDNALLFATLALLKAQFYPEWSQPILQMVFVGAYILFAPFVGQVADSFAKGRVMMFANGLKLLGAASICFGINPFLGYTLVGVGAAAYSPAKYGILGELTTGSKLVKANGLMEASTIAAILLGSVAGGVLADWHVLIALAACALAYGGAVIANIYIPKLAAARPGQSWNLISMTRSFLNACTSLWRNGETRFSLVGTSLFWGAGVTLRFLLVLWGFFVVPLNALLQERGKKSVGAGNAIAVQNLGENSAMLLMLGIYSLAVMVGIPVVPIGIGFGALFALAITALWIWQRRH
ncbi:lysophospholipid transporter LplT [Escherichia coli]|nr:lysophospholipid transporter LplT [Escherichia coli]